MNVLFIAAECAPFVKVGGLGDVVGALPNALSRLGHSVRVIVPHHGVVEDAYFEIKLVDTFPMLWNEGTVRVEVSGVARDGVQYYFVRGWPFFSGHEKFIYHFDEGIDVGRFLFLSAAALQWVKRLAASEGWKPDVYHVHDWHTGLVPYLLTQVYYDDPVLGSAASLFSIHNLRYQGWGIGWHLKRAGLPPVDHVLLHAVNRTDNALAVGLAYSTMLSTVSPRYAQEIVAPEGGYGLDGLLHARLMRLVGILNGIDTRRWDPASSENIPQRFDARSLDRRVRNKLELQAELGLPQRADVPLLGTVTRLVEQKGPAIMAPMVRHLLSSADVQFVLLGTGHYQYENDAWWIGHDFPGKAAIRLNFDEALSERIYAGCDLFLMPSLFEPCGIGQMIAMRYGALPVVRAVGGLIDTVRPDVGFLFADFHPSALGWAVERALDVYRNEPEEWRARQQRAMALDFSWEGSARRYVDLYEQTMAVRRSYI